jgi:hypothetical protein
MAWTAFLPFLVFGLVTWADARGALSCGVMDGEPDRRLRALAVRRRPVLLDLSQRRTRSSVNVRLLTCEKALG